MSRPARTSDTSSAKVLRAGLGGVRIPPQARRGERQVPVGVGSLSRALRRRPGNTGRCMTTTPAPEVLQLSSDDRLTLVGLMLHLMDADIDQTKDREVAEGRIGVRNALRYETRLSQPDGKAGHSALEIESGHVLADRLRAVASEAHGIQMLVEIALFEPWLTPALAEKRRGRISQDARESVAAWARGLLPGTSVDLKVIRRQLEGYRLVRGLKILGAGAGVAALGVATAGVAAPAIGGVIGGAMGLSGAAATSAGLAWLGGGSLAAGGFGMAGGTALLAALGAAGGGGLGAFAAAQTEKSQAKQLDLEIKKLRALIHLCAGADARATQSIAVEQQLLIEAELAALLSERVHAAIGKSSIDGLLEQEIVRVTELRDAVGFETFPLEPC